MNPFQPFLITGSNQGLETDKKSFLLPDNAYPVLENAYIWRERLKKREGIRLIGRLRRSVSGQVQANTDGTVNYSIADILTSFRSDEPKAQIDPGTLVLTIDAGGSPVVLTDQGDGTLLRTSGTAYQITNGTYIDYSSGSVTIVWQALSTPGVVTVTSTYFYFPMLPVMGIPSRERSNINFEQTLVFDTKYCYTYSGTSFSEYLAGSGVTWNGNNYQFFQWTNFQGSVASSRELYVTNFNLEATGNPIRYTDGLSWTTFEPSVGSTLVQNETVGTVTTPWNSFAGNLVNTEITPGTVTITVYNATDGEVIFTDPSVDGTLQGSPSTNSGTINYSTGAITLSFSPNLTTDSSVKASYKYNSTFLFSCRILIPFFGRLLAINTFEGETRATSTQFYNRCRFSQIGSPTQDAAWDSTIFGRGGFIDAPTNEQAISAVYFKSTLIVFFERSTWQLRYQGEYGIPFLWERISSDFGSESQFSTIIFDDNALTVGDRAIIASTAQGVNRIDEKIPDLIFKFRNANEGIQRVQGIRDFQKEIVYWCYNDSQDSESGQIFPNKTLVFNYRNNTWATFRNNTTAFGTYYASDAITWDSTDIYWDDYETTWDDAATQEQFPFIIGGNQQGYVHIYGQQSFDDPSLVITSIDRSVTPPRLTIPNHNLQDGDIIYLSDLQFIDISTSTPIANTLDGSSYVVTTLIPYDQNIVEISKWDTTSQSYIDDFSYTPANGVGTYVGYGQATLLPRMNILTKDFSPFMNMGKQTKLGYIDFLTEETPSGTVSVRIYGDTTFQEAGNLLVGQRTLPTQSNPQFFSNDSDLYWNRFYCTSFGQFISVQITYSDDQMADRSIIDNPFTLLALTLWMKPGGRVV